MYQNATVLENISKLCGSKYSAGIRDKFMCVTIEIPVQHSVVVGFALAPLILVMVALASKTALRHD